MIKQFFKDTPNSVFFWNGVVVFTIIGAFLWDIDKGYFSIVLLLICSFLLLISAMGEGPNYQVIGYHWWAYASPVLWFAYVLGMLIWLAIEVYKLIKKFNKFLNR
jgi:hypothetical protein